MRERIEQVAATFAAGYHAGLEAREVSDVAPALAVIPLERRGFAFEGAAMALALLDRLSPWHRPSRIARFLRGAGEAHVYMVYVGVGWALARLPTNHAGVLARSDPLLRWLILDGWGFHEGFFRTREYAAGGEGPARLHGYERRAFDQGLGRSLWFSDGGDVARLPQTIGGFAPHRRADLWSGVGLACAYAGILEDAIRAGELRDAAGPHAPALAQGAAFAAKARLLAGNPAPHTELTCQVLCGSGAAEAARETDQALENLPADGPDPAYETWRQRVQSRYALSRPVLP